MLEHLSLELQECNPEHPMLHELGLRPVLAVP
jgi:hypothetical protein